MVLPVIFGAIFTREFSKTPNLAVRWLHLLWGIAIAGVWLGVFVEYPWADSTRLLGSHDVGIAKTADYLGVERKPGFARAPYAAALQATLCMLPLVCYSTNKAKIWTVYGITVITVLITFSKTAAMVIVVVGLLLVMDRRWRARSGKAVILGCFAIGCTVPLTTVFISVGSGRIDGTWGFLLASLEERFRVAWPEALALMERQGAWLTGRGAGGFDTPQKLYGLEAVAAVDNFYLFVMGTYGLLGIIALGALLWALVTLDVTSRWREMIMLAAVALSLWGLTRIILEEYFGMFFLGIIASGVARLPGIYRRFDDPYSCSVNAGLKRSEATGGAHA